MARARNAAFLLVALLLLKSVDLWAQSTPLGGGGSSSGGGANANGTYVTADNTNAPVNNQVLTAGTGITVTPNAGAHTITVASTITGTVTSVAQTVPQCLSVSGSPVTTSGTLAITRKAPQALGNVNVNTTLDFNSGCAATLTATGAFTFTFSNLVSGETYTIEVTNNGTAFVITWPGTVKWPNNVVPVATGTNNKKDLYTFFYDGTDLLGTFVGNF